MIIIHVTSRIFKMCYVYITSSFHENGINQIVRLCTKIFIKTYIISNKYIDIDIDRGLCYSSTNIDSYRELK